MIFNRSRFSALLIALTLVACGKEEKAASGSAVGGEVMEGTISDAMLPLDTARSQPPLAPKTGSTAASSDADDATQAEDGKTTDASVSAGASAVPPTLKPDGE